MDSPDAHPGQHGEGIVHEGLQRIVPARALDGGGARVPRVVGHHVMRPCEFADGRKEHPVVIGVAVHQEQAGHVRARFRAKLEHGQHCTGHGDRPAPLVQRLHMFPLWFLHISGSLEFSSPGRRWLRAPAAAIRRRPRGSASPTGPHPTVGAITTH